MSFQSFAPASVAKAPQPKSILAVVFLTVFIDLLGFGITIPLSPHLASNMGASSVEVGRLMAIYSLLQFVFSPVWGRLSDRFGRRPIMLISIAGTGLAHLAFAFSDQLWMLFAARAFAGFFGANIATAMACMADVSGPTERSKNMGLIGAAFGLGFLFGPLIGGVGGIIGEHLGAQPPYGMSFGAVIAFLLSLMNWSMALVRLPETLPVEKRAQASANRRNRFATLLTFARKPTINMLMLIYFFAVLSMAMMEPMMFLYMKDRFGWDLKASSFGFAYVGVVMVFTQGYFIRKLMPRFGERKLLIVGLVLTALGLSGIGLAPDLWVMALAVTLLGLGTGFTNPSATGSISLLTSPQEQGLVIGVTQSLASLSRVIGPEISGHVYQWHNSGPFLSGAIVVAIAALFGLSAWRNLPEQGKI